MTANHLDDLIRATPFQQFTLHLADARSVRVPAVDCFTWSLDGRSVFVFLPGSNETELIDLSLVVSIRFGESAADAGIIA